MGSTGVLPFVRGIDFSRNDFGVSLLSIILFYQFKCDDLLNL